MEIDAIREVRPTVMVVDDEPDNLELMRGLLTPQYRVLLAPNGEKALALLAHESLPDLILLDVMMPVLDGHAVCRRLKADGRTAAIPVMFLTARGRSEDEQFGLSLGAIDYLSKPLNPAVLLSRVAAHLALKISSDVLRDKAAWLEAEVARRAQEITDLQDVTILAMASLAETRDNDTGNHIRRTQHYVRLLARRLSKEARFADALNDATIDLLFKSAPLHDLGKVGIADHILLKPSHLTEEEFEIMKTHTTLGRDALETAEQRLGRPMPFLQMAKEIAYSHQEKWDGSGYPQGLQGDSIPLSARLMALGDVYDALISRRVYKDPMSHDDAVALILQGRGHHFDPDIVDAFEGLQEEFKRVAQKYADT